MYIHKQAYAEAGRLVKAFATGSTAITDLMLENAVASVMSSVMSRESTVAQCGMQSLMTALRRSGFSLSLSSLFLFSLSLFHLFLSRRLSLSLPLSLYLFLSFCSLYPPSCVPGSFSNTPCVSLCNTTCVALAQCCVPRAMPCGAGECAASAAALMCDMTLLGVCGLCCCTHV